MSSENRHAQLTALQDAYGGPVITYVTSERQGMETKIAGDVIFLFRRHLEAISDVEKIGLLLVSRGGDTLVPWQLVNMVREFAPRVDALVPYTAHSAATLICLGADSIIMSKIGTLSPIDPTVANPFNPTDPNNPNARVGISVEDVSAFMALAKNQGISEAGELTQVFLSLTQNVHPLALGNVQRSHSQIRRLAQELLMLHTSEGEAEQVKKIVYQLTEGLHSHGHTISRREAKNIGLKVEEPTNELATAMLALFDQYVADLEMFSTFNPQAMLGAADSCPLQIQRAFVESERCADVFVSDGQIRRIPAGALPPAGFPGQVQIPGALQPQLAIELSFEGWRRLR